MSEEYLSYVKQDELDREQRRDHRASTYSMVFFIIVSLYLMFFFGLFCDGLSEEIIDNPHFVYLLALLGIMPTLLLTSVIRALYKDEKNENDKLGKDSPTAQAVELIGKEIRDRL